MEDWRERFQQSPHFRKIRLGLWRKWRPLARDKQFLLETAKLKLRLSATVKTDELTIRSFFRPTFEPTLLDANKTRNRLKRIADNNIRDLLSLYVNYVYRFGVVLRLEETPPYFRTQMLTDVSRKFDVRVVGGNFEPANLSSWDAQTPVAELFGDDSLQVGPELQAMIDEGAVSFVRIEDSKGRSVLKQLLDFAYSPNDLTFIQLNGDRPHLMCLIGENLSVDTTWRNASKVVAEFQKEQLGRVRAGRPPALKQLRRRLARLLRSEGTLKNKAIDLATDTTAKAVQSELEALSRLNSRLKI